MDRTELEKQVLAIVADALDRPLEQVHQHASLIDDLGAESIDLLDIVYRFEQEFGIKLPDEEIWKGRLFRVADDPESLAREIASLRELTPGFRWDRLPPVLSRKDLPRLITPRTAIEFLEPRLVSGEPPAPS